MKTPIIYIETVSLRKPTALAFFVQVRNICHCGIYTVVMPYPKKRDDRQKMKDKMPMLKQNQKSCIPTLKPNQCSTFAFAPTLKINHYENQIFKRFQWGCNTYFVQRRRTTKKHFN
jgi:hypothetical protein